MSGAQPCDHLDVEPDQDPEQHETYGVHAPSDDSENKTRIDGGLLPQEDVVISPAAENDINNPVVAEETSDDVPFTQEVKDREFWMACRRGDLEEVQFWLKLGANVNTEREYWKPMWSWQNADSSSVKSVLEEDIGEYEQGFGAPELGDQNPRKRKARSLGIMSAIFVAVFGGRLDVAQDLLKHKEIFLGGQYTKDKATAFYQAALEPNGDDLVRKFLSHSQAVQYLDTPDDHGLTALCHCAIGGSVNKIRLILQRGANVNTLDYQGCSPLFRAVQYAPERARLATAKLLLVYGADVNLAASGINGKYYSANPPLQRPKSANRQERREISITYGGAHRRF